MSNLIPGIDVFHLFHWNLTRSRWIFPTIPSSHLHVSSHLWGTGRWGGVTATSNWTLPAYSKPQLKFWSFESLVLLFSHPTQHWKRDRSLSSGLQCVAFQALCHRGCFVHSETAKKWSDMDQFIWSHFIFAMEKQHWAQPNFTTCCKMCLKCIKVT